MDISSEATARMPHRVLAGSSDPRQPAHDRTVPEKRTGGPETAPGHGAREEIVKLINTFLREMAGELQFILGSEPGSVVIRVIDGEGKIIREIPFEKGAELIRRLDEMAGRVGILVDEAT